MDKQENKKPAAVAIEIPDQPKYSFVLFGVYVLCYMFVVQLILSHMSLTLPQALPLAFLGCIFFDYFNYMTIVVALFKKGKNSLMVFVDKSTVQINSTTGKVEAKDRSDRE